jgi:tocopherol O-methyltransferase
MTISVSQHYDALFWSYRIFWGDHLHHGLFLTGQESPREAQLNMLRHCVALLPNRPRGRILDVGCGLGGTSLFLAREFQCHTHGISVSAKQVAHARRSAKRKRLSSLTSFDVADAEQVQFPHNSFDLVWVMESSEHFNDRAGFFSRVSEWLRPQGMLLLASWTANHKVEMNRLRPVAEASICPNFSCFHEYCAMMRDAGLRIQMHQDITDSVMKTWEIVSARVQPLKIFARLTSAPTREFSQNLDLIYNAFSNRLLTYQLWVATSPKQ